MKIKNIRSGVNGNLGRGVNGEFRGSCPHQNSIRTASVMGPARRGSEAETQLQMGFYPPPPTAYSRYKTIFILMEN